MEGPQKFIDWLLEMGYMEQSDIPTDKEEIIADIRKIRMVAPKFYNMMMQVMAMDNTHLKEALKYHALMCFMTHYREMVKIEDKGRRTKRQAKALRKDVTKPLPLIRKQYVIEEVDSKVLRLPDQKRTYTKPEHEVSVRGYMRHYKSGKSVWIEPFTKYRGKGKNRKDYEL